MSIQEKDQAIELPPRPSWLKRSTTVVLPLLSFALVLIGWQWAVVGMEIPRYILPAPSLVLPRLVEDWRLLWDNLMVTSWEVVLGFGWAILVSIPLGYLLARSRTSEKAIYPVVVFFQLIPKIAIAPLFIVWFGFGLFPKVLLTFLLCFFPLLVAAMNGFKSIDDRVLYLTRSMGASAWETFRFVRVPTALPYIFTGLRVSVVFAATGAIVGEFVGSNAGLGYLLLRGTTYLDTPLIFSVLVVLSAMGLFFNYVIVGLEYLMMPWQRTKRLSH